MESVQHCFLFKRGTNKAVLDETKQTERGKQTSTVIRSWTAFLWHFKKMHCFFHMTKAVHQSGNESRRDTSILEFFVNDQGKISRWSTMGSLHNTGGAGVCSHQSFHGHDPAEEIFPFHNLHVKERLFRASKLLRYTCSFDCKRAEVKSSQFFKKTQNRQWVRWHVQLRHLCLSTRGNLKVPAENITHTAPFRADKGESRTRYKMQTSS